MESSGVRFRGVADSATATIAPSLRPPDLPAGAPTDAVDDGFWPVIASRDEIPAWLRDNDYLLGGHPMPTASYRRSYRLWRCLHMETMNIWTHLLASIGFAIAGVTICIVWRDNPDRYVLPGDIGVFAIFFAACAVAFAFSANFHTLRSHSYRIHHLWGKLDILGICALAFGGGFSATYFAFYDDATVRYIYWALNAGAAAAAAVTLLDTGGGGSKMRALRGSVFAALTASAMAPIIQRSVQLGWQQGCRQIGTHHYVAEGLVLLLGACLFVGRVPERWRPGTFDVWGHSHQLWHACAALGMVLHGMALVVGHRFHQGAIR